MQLRQPRQQLQCTDARRGACARAMWLGRPAGRGWPRVTCMSAAAQHLLGPTGSAASLKPADLAFRPCQVIRNEALNAENSVRLLHISIPDHVEILYGRKVQGVVDSPRWLDEYTVPGQCVALRTPGSTSPPGRLYSIAATPYESRRDSSYIDASLTEVVVEKGGPDGGLADLPPGADLEISQVLGRGWASLLSPADAASLPVALEQDRPLLFISVGARGMVPARAALSWTPVAAHASRAPRRRVACLVADTSPATALFVSDWEGWRSDGVLLQPVYSDGAWDVDAAALSADPSQHARVEELLDKALFLREGGFNSLAGGSPAEVVVLLSGVCGAIASALSKKLAARGVSHDRILFADFL